MVRDAASKLIDGYGTRADICELLKDSQYINESCSDSQINNIVSGALDRLHYEKDPCVRYDLHKKLWIYLHRDRTLDYPGWKITDDEEPANTNIKVNNGVIIINKKALVEENEESEDD